MAGNAGSCSNIKRLQMLHASYTESVSKDEYAITVFRPFMDEEPDVVYNFYFSHAAAKYRVFGSKSFNR